MIPHRLGRLLGAVLLLAPSLAFGQTALQQPCMDRTKGCTVQPVPAALGTLYANDLFLQSLISTRFSQLGAASFLNVGSVTGTVADGGALAAEIVRAQAAETANTGAISTERTRALAAEAVLQAAISQSGTSYAVNYVAQSLTSPQQLQARQNVGAAAAGANTDITSLSGPALGAATATTAAAGTNTTQVATTAFATGALSSYAGTVAATYLPQSTAASTYLAQATAASTYAPLATAVRTDAAQAFTAAQQAQGRQNLFVPSMEAVRTGWISQSQALGAPLPLWDATADAYQSAAGIGGDSTNASVQNGTVVNQASDPNALALLHFDGTNGATTTTDSSQYARTVTLTSATISTAQSQFGSTSLNIATGGNANAGASASWLLFGSNYTLEAWVRPSAISGTQTIFEIDNSTSDYASVVIASTGNVGIIAQGSQVNATGATLTANTWAHVAAVRNGTTTTIYVNGTSAGTITGLTYPSTGTPTLRIGGGTVYASLVGYLDEVRVSNSARYPTNFTSSASAFAAGTSGLLDLRSIAWTAQAVPTKGSLFLLVKALSGTLTPNTNFTASLSRDGGTNWTNATLASVGVIGGYSVLEANEVDLTGQNANSNVKYRAQTSDPALSLAIDAAVVGWR